MNVLIIGQGIAGSCLAWELKRRGADFTIADRPIAETASRVAAGLVNPLTGRALAAGGMPVRSGGLLSGDGTGTGRLLVAEDPYFPGTGNGGPAGNLAGTPDGPGVLRLCGPPFPMA